MANGTVALLESFPFDSDFNDDYDDEGYPLYDRAVGARLLRKTLDKMFTTGVWPSPADNLKLSVGTGYTLNVSHGVGIIDGGIGGVFDDGGMDIVLCSEPPRGIVTYAVMLRLDDNDDARGIFVRVAETSGSTPDDPVIEGAVHELRLGYVTMPSGAESIQDGTVTDERGTSVCPYCSPFEDIDMSAVVDEARRQALRVVDSLGRYVDANIGLIASVLDETTAGYLSNRIHALENPTRLTPDQLRYYLGYTTVEPAGWQSDWKTYEQEVADAAE